MVWVEVSIPPIFEDHPSPSCICPGPISVRGQISEKFHLWCPKIDFCQSEQRWPEHSKTLSRCSLRLCWPPPSVVSIYMTLGEIWIFDNFGRFWRFWENPRYGLYPPPEIRYTPHEWEKSNHCTWDPHNHRGGAKVMGGQGFGTYEHASYVVSHRFDFWYRVISIWPNLVRIRLCSNPY